MYWRAPDASGATVPGGHPMERKVADSHAQWPGPAIVTSSNWLTGWPARVHA